MSTQYLMMIAFLLLFSISIWKLQAFFSTKELVDDDRNEVSINLLYGYIYQVLQNSDAPNTLNMQELYEKVIQLNDFDTKHFWRLTPHRILNMVNEFYVVNEVDDLASMLGVLRAHDSKRSRV